MAKLTLQLPPRILKNPKSGRTSSQSGYISVGKEMEKSLTSYNRNVARDQRAKLSASAISFSRSVADTALDAMTMIDSNVFRRGMGKRSFQEIKTGTAPKLFQSALSDVLDEMEHQLPELKLASGKWAARAGLINALRNLKKAPSRKSSNGKTADLSNSKVRDCTKKSSCVSTANANTFPTNILEPEEINEPDEVIQGNRSEVSYDSEEEIGEETDEGGQDCAAGTTDDEQSDDLTMDMEGTSAAPENLVQAFGDTEKAYVGLSRSRERNTAPSATVLEVTGETRDNSREMSPLRSKRRKVAAPKRTRCALVKKRARTGAHPLTKSIKKRTKRNIAPAASGDRASNDTKKLKSRNVATKKASRKP